MGGQPFGYIFQPNDGATEWDFSKEKPVFDQGAYWTVLPVYTEHRSTIDALVGALEFYADPKRYEGPNQRPVENDPYAKPDDAYLRDVTRDGGDIARAALLASKEGR